MAWNSYCMTLLTTFPAGLAGPLWEMSAEVGFFGILGSCELLIFLGWKAVNWGNISKALSCKWISHFISYHMRDKEGGQLCLEHAIMHPTIKMAKKEPLVICDSMVPSGSGGLWSFPFLVFKRGELCSREHTQSQGCFIVGCGCVTSWDP